MMLRVVLVGVVAALGVSIPSQPSCEHWYDSAQSWATSLLAEWDTWTATDTAEPRLPGAANHLGCEECRLARMRLVAKANENLSKDTALVDGAGPKTGTQKKPSDSDQRVARSQPKTVSPRAFELTEAAAAFCPIAAIILNGTPDLHAGSASTSRENQASVAGPELSEPAEAAELVIWSGFCRLGNEAISSAAESESEVLYSDEDGSDMPITQESFICGFSAFAPPFLTAATAPPEVPEAARSVAERVADDDATDGMIMSCLDEALGWDEVVDVVASAPTVDPFLADLPVDVFVPERAAVIATVPAPPSNTTQDAAVAVAVAGPGRPALSSFLEDLPSDVFAPMPPSPDQELAAKDRPLADVGPQPARLGDAVELTRRAVSAWVSVLIGPALVQEGARR